MGAAEVELVALVELVESGFAGAARTAVVSVRRRVMENFILIVGVDA